MAHAAIYEAPPGSVIVIDAGDDRFAVAGGNVCATAAQRDIAGFVIDGVIRDVAEIRDMKFPVFARGTVPKPGKKNKTGQLGIPITCGGITVRTGDLIVADEDGIVVIAADTAAEVLEKTRKKCSEEKKQSLADWQEEHHQKITSLLNLHQQSGNR